MLLLMRLNVLVLQNLRSLQCAIQRQLVTTNHSKIPRVFYEDENLSNRVPRISFPQKQISFNLPSSPNNKITTTEIISSGSSPTQQVSRSLLSLFCVIKESSIFVNDSVFFFLVRNYQGQVGLKSASKLPFLLKIHYDHFQVCLGLCSLIVLWKTLEENTSSAIHFPFNLPAHFTTGLWFVALLSFVLISVSQLLKYVFHFETVCMEYLDRVWVNYFFVPWIAAVLLRLGLPSSITPDKVHPLAFCLFVFPFSVLDLKIYCQWFVKGKRCLSRVTNPSTYLSVVDIPNFVHIDIEFQFFFGLFPYMT